MLLSLMQQLLDTSAAQDIEIASVELSYRLSSCPLLVRDTHEAKKCFRQRESWAWGSELKQCDCHQQNVERENYSNLFASRQDSIVCADNDKSRDINEPCDCLEWSQILIQFYQTLAFRTLQPTSELRTIWRFWIVNNETIQIFWLSHIHWCEDGNPLVLSERSPHVFRLASDLESEDGIVTVEQHNIDRYFGLQRNAYQTIWSDVLVETR